MTFDTTERKTQHLEKMKDHERNLVKERQAVTDPKCRSNRCAAAIWELVISV